MLQDLEVKSNNFTYISSIVFLADFVAYVMPYSHWEKVIQESQLG
jgi:hypothetical protein